MLKFLKLQNELGLYCRSKEGRPIPVVKIKFSFQEHHLQRAMVTGLIIPTPEVNNVGDISVYDLLYPPDYKVSRQLIHMQRELTLHFYFSCGVILLVLILVGNILKCCDLRAI